MKKIILFLFVLVAAILFSGANAFSQEDKYAHDGYNIEGVFTCDWNGTYYVRQLGNEVFWYGEDDNVTPLWSNIAHGMINGNILTLTWADVPKGTIMQNGKLVIKINSNDNFELTTQEGDHFGSSVWNKKQQ